MIGGLFSTELHHLPRMTSVVFAHVDSHPVVEVYHFIPVTFVEMFLLPIVFCVPFAPSWGVTNLNVTVICNPLVIPQAIFLSWNAL